MHPTTGGQGALHTSAIGSPKLPFGRYHLSATRRAQHVTARSAVEAPDLLTERVVLCTVCCRTDHTERYSPGELLVDHREGCHTDRTVTDRRAV
jgi:hypothetical protein